MKIKPISSEHKQITVKCCGCDRIRLSGRWVAQPEHLPSGVLYSHGYCPACYHMAMEELAVLPLAAASR